MSTSTATYRSRSTRNCSRQPRTASISRRAFGGSTPTRSWRTTSRDGRPARATRACYDTRAASIWRPERATMRADQSAMPALEGAIARWAAARPDIQALAVVGSYARADHPADPWSDLDLVLFVDDPIPYLESAGWLEAIAPPRITFTEPTALGIGRERRVLFEGGLDVDFTLLPATWLDALDAK